MGDAEDLAEILAPQLREVVAREIRACGLMNEPDPIAVPPTAIECERTVLATVLSGKMAIAELGDLRCSDFYLPFHRWLFAHLESGITEHPRLRDLALDELVAPEFVALCAREVASRTVVMLALAEVTQTARARRIIDSGKAILNRLQSGEIEPDEALDALGKMASGPRRTAK